ncbi:MAG: hypothetical protein ACKVZ0_08445 [Gemmatimonadales bacterium]
MSWFRDRDELGERADRLAGQVARRFEAEWDEVVAAVPALGGVNREAWLRAATVAAVSLTVFPLLRACHGEMGRFDRLRLRVFAGLEARFPKSAGLVREAEGATVPPSGHERAQTLNEVDEATSLALAGWVLRHLGVTSGRSWQDIRGIAPVLQRAVHGCWLG